MIKRDIKEDSAIKAGYFSHNVDTLINYLAFSFRENPWCSLFCDLTADKLKAKLAK